MTVSKTSILTLTAIALVTGGLLAGCEKRTTTTDTPAGSATTTTVTPSASASQGLERAGDAIVDAAITAKVKAALLIDDEVKGLQIDVDTKDSVVTLNGSAGTQALVGRAETVAKGVDGVKSVQNRLTATGATTSGVGSSASAAVGTAATTAGAAADRAADSTARAADKTGDAIGDAAITAKVKTAFLADADVKGLQIDVDTSNGAVSLTGTLNSRTHVERAESIAKGIDGVKSVNNRLTVKAGG